MQKSPNPKRSRIFLAVDAMHPGGVSTFIFRLSEELMRHGYDVEVVALEQPGAWFPLLMERGIRGTFFKPLFSWLPAFLVLHYLRVACYFRNHADVTFLSVSRTLQAFLAVMRAGQISVPVIHSDVEALYRWGLANSSCWQEAVAVSGKVLEECRKRVPDKMVNLIHYGIEIPSTDLVASRKPHSPKLRLLYLGRLVIEQKNILLLKDILAECLNRGCDAWLTVVGDGEDRERLVCALTDAKLIERVEFHPFCNPADVGRYYLDHHVLLLPSHHEAFGMVLTEAQAHGCVPVANRLEGITTEAVADQVTGLLIDDNSVSGYGDVLEKLCSDGGYWSSISQKGITYARENYSRQRMGDEYDQLIQRLRKTQELVAAGTPRRRIAWDMIARREWLPSWGQAWLAVHENRKLKPQKKSDY